MEISEILKETRVSRNITQEKLAEEMDVSRQTISNWENGKSYPDIVSIIRLSDFYNISLDKLLKEDKKLIDNLQKNTDTVMSNKYMILTLILTTIIYSVIYLVRKNIEIPKIDNLFLNIALMVVLFVAAIVFLFKKINISNILNAKTSNKTILKTIMIVLLIISFFVIYPIIEQVIHVEWQVFVIRLLMAFVLCAVCFLLSKKIDNC